jgi:hypothetical protein
MSDPAGASPAIFRYFRVLTTPAHDVGWAERHVTSSHHRTAGDWETRWRQAPKGFREDPELEGWRLLFPTAHVEGPGWVTHSTLGARAAFLAYAAAHPNQTIFPEYVQTGVGEYHGLSAFKTAAKAASYATGWGAYSRIGTIWGSELGLLPDDESLLAPDSVRVAVCHWEEPPLSVPEFCRVHHLDLPARR